MSPREHCLEETNVVPACRIESGKSPASGHFRFCQIGNLLISRRRVIHNGQRIQIAVVGGAAHPLLTRQAAELSEKSFRELHGVLLVMRVGTTSS